MTEQEHIEVSRKLALAIGWKPEQIKESAGYLLVDGRMFDYQFEYIAFRVAERFDCFPYKNSSGNWVCSLTCGGHYEPSHFYSGNTPQLTIALAVIAAQGVK